MCPWQSCPSVICTIYTWQRLSCWSSQLIIPRQQCRRQQQLHTGRGSCHSSNTSQSKSRRNTLINCTCWVLMHGKTTNSRCFSMPDRVTRKAWTTQPDNEHLFVMTHTLESNVNLVSLRLSANLQYLAAIGWVADRAKNTVKQDQGRFCTTAAPRSRVRGSEGSGIGASGRGTATGCSPIGACVALYQNTGSDTWLNKVLKFEWGLKRVTYLMVLLCSLYTMQYYSHAKQLQHSTSQ